jgi:hypothetical protein
MLTFMPSGRFIKTRAFCTKKIETQIFIKHERRVSSFLYMHDLTSSSDAGRLYVERKFLVN